MIIALSAFVGVARTAVAAEVPDGAVLPAVVVTAPEERAAAPTAFHTVIRPAEQPQSFTTVTELLATAPGTQVRQLGSPGQFASVTIRGSSAEQVAVYLDGARLNSAGTGVVDLATIPLGAVDRIEVIRGGGSAQFGSDAIGGVVNISTANAPLGTTTAASVTGGSFLTLQGNASFAHRDDTQRVLISATHWSSDGDFSFHPSTTTLAGTTLAGNTARVREHNRTLGESLLLQYGTQSDAHTEFRATNDFYFGDRQLPGLEVEATQLAPLNPLEATQQLYRDTATAGITFTDLGTEGLQLDIGLNNVFEVNRFDDPSPALGPAIARTAYSNGLNPHVRMAYTRGNATFTNTLAARYDFRFDLFDDRARNRTTTAAGTQVRDTHTLLLHDEWQPWRDRLFVAPSLRLTTTPTVTRHAEYRLGILGRPLPWLALLGNIETAHRLPTLLELYHPDQGFIRGNPDLDAERAWHWDAGARIETAVVQADVAYFQQHIHNSILFVPISATTIAPINTFAVRSDGIEASATLQPWEWMRLSANYTWLRAAFRSTGLQLPGRPRHAATARLELAHDLSARLRGSGYTEGHWVGAMPLNVDNTVFIAGRVTLDVGLKATWQPRTGHEYFAALEARNVSNVQIYDARGFPQPRRAFYLTVGGKWG
ncbi:MAG: TonB-dependent receptor [Deltaproteobacteria bacterium]|nr:TonB-dependent receptor [Deltaproteobacteria bacterium]